MKTFSLIYSLILFNLLSTNIALAQSTTHVSGIDDVLTKLNLNRSITGDLNYSYQDIDGSPFIFEGFSKGTIKLKKSAPIEGDFRFDKYAEEIQFKKNEILYAIAFPKEVEYIQIDSLKFIYSEFILPDHNFKNEQDTYFIIKADGPYKLLVKTNISIKNAQPSNGIVPAMNAKFITKSDSYFIKKLEEPAIKIQNEKSMLSIFSDKKEEISNFIKSNHLSTKKLDDLKEIVTYYNLSYTSN
ncbi:MAG: hypothetical protein GZ086_05195 [Gelidibacter sp.]|nr:hypothetical protein [Gelidibacter sp.]